MKEMDKCLEIERVINHALEHIEDGSNIKYIIDGYHQYIHACEDLRKRYEELLGDKDKTNNELNNKLNEAYSQIKYKDINENKLEAQIKELKSELEKSNLDLKKSNDEINNLIIENNRLKSELEKSNLDLVISEAEKNKLDVDLKLITTIKESLEKENESLKAEQLSEEEKKALKLGIKFKENRAKGNKRNPKLKDEYIIYLYNKGFNNVTISRILEECGLDKCTRTTINLRIKELKDKSLLDIQRKKLSEKENNEVLQKYILRERTHNLRYLEEVIRLDRK